MTTAFLVAGLLLAAGYAFLTNESPRRSPGYLITLEDRAPSKAAVVLINMGTNEYTLKMAAEELPENVAFSFSPYAMYKRSFGREVIETIKADVVIDTDFYNEDVKKQLDLAEHTALKQGKVIVAAVAKPNIIIALRLWADGFNAQNNLELVPISMLIEEEL